MIQNLIKIFVPPKKMIDMFTYEIISKQPIEQITKQTSELFDKYNFSLLKTYNYHEIVEEKGFPIDRKVYIYEICQAKPAAQMLSDYPYFSIFMPCKLVAYEKDGNAVVSTMNMEIMLSAVKQNQELYQNATSLFATLKKLMSELK